MFKKLKIPLVVLLLTLLPYIFFFHSIFKSNIVIGGSDPLKYFYPSRFYLWQQLKTGKFPFWTEKIFSGYPIYADSERGYLNIINIALIYLLGPFTSYKLEHFLLYLTGSFCFYIFLKRKSYTMAGFFVSNVIYYFSFFMLYHQQHFNMLLTAYTIPIGLLLIDNFLLNYNIKWLIFFSLLGAFNIYLGSFQAVFIFLIVSLSYFYFFKKTLKIRQFLQMSSLTFALTLSLSAPTLLPTTQLYLNSARLHTNSKLQNEGSFNPIMIVNTIYPYFFQNKENYKWNIINSEYFIHETYIYAGVAALLLALLALPLITDKNLKYFSLFNIFLFFTLGFIKNIPFLNTYNIFPFSLFRYWGRAVLLFSLGISLSAGYFISNYKTLNNYKSSLKYTAFVIAYFLIITVSNLPNLEIKSTFHLFTSGGFTPDIIFGVWIIVSAIALITAMLKTKIPKADIILSLLVVLDLYIFGNEIITDYTRNISNVVPNNQLIKTDMYTNERVAFINYYAFWNMNLYYSNWGILGYSQLIPQNYLKTLRKNKIPNTETLSSNISLQNLINLGVTTFITSESTIIIQKSPNDIIQKSNALITKLSRSEGKYTLTTQSPSGTLINTGINNYPGWQLKINGKIQELNQDETNLSFNVPKGLSKIELIFYPVFFLYGIYVLLICTPACLVIFKKCRI